MILANRSPAAVHEVREPATLREVLSAVADGDVVRIHSGEFPSGNSISGISNLTIEAADPASPPVFKGGSQAFHFSRCRDLTLRHLHCTGQSGNGINLDDGGPQFGFVSGVTLEHLVISDVGPNGNFDAIKCSGLSDLTIRDCRINGWGGQAIDLVGCRRVLISGCKIEGKPGFSQHTGPQFKGGCEDITIENCVLLHAGLRPIQAGGSTGLAFIRPPGATFEARNVTIRNNRIEGGDCACAFTGVDGAIFTGNTIVNPTKWIFRILTETREPGFPPARNVVISDNVITYHRGKLQTHVNIGDHTAPETFRFSGNRWFAEDRPAASKPVLPVEETGGLHGQPPEP
jgi:hypothetical protein